MGTKKVGRGGHNKNVRPESFFWPNVQKSDGCWEWTAATVHGYGVTRYEGKRQTAHRVSWKLARGAIPGALWVLHHCDNPRCVRPDHLFLGTSADNTTDMMSKNRGRSETRRGEAQRNAKVTTAQVLDIRRRCAAGETLRAVAGLLGISPTTVHAIAQRRTWRHVPEVA